MNCLYHIALKLYDRSVIGDKLKGSAFCQLPYLVISSEYR